MSLTKDIARFSNKVIKALNNVDSGLDMKVIGQFALDAIKIRTRLGYGVDSPGAKRKRLKRLSNSYIDYRRGRVRFYRTAKSKKLVAWKGKFKVPLSELTKPSKSNLTYSGQLIDSLKFRLSGRRSVEIGPTGSRTKVRPGEKSRTNQQVSKYVQKDRPYLNLSNNELRQITQLAQDMITKRVKKNLTDLQ